MSEIGIQLLLKMNEELREELAEKTNLLKAFSDPGFWLDHESDGILKLAEDAVAKYEKKK